MGMHKWVVFSLVRQCCGAVALGCRVYHHREQQQPVSVNVGRDSLQPPAPAAPFPRSLLLPRQHWRLRSLVQGSRLGSWSARRHSTRPPWTACRLSWKLH